MLQFNFPFFVFLRKNKLLATLSFVGIVGLSPNITFAQVSVNQSALNHLGPAQQTKKAQKTKQSLHKNQQHNRTGKPNQNSQHHNTTPSSPTTQQTAKPVILPTIPNAPPPIPVFKDADITVPLHPTAPPPMPAINPKAEGKVIATNKYTLLAYAPNNVDLNENMMKAVMAFANNLKQHPNVTVFLNAYSHNVTDDPSTPRRIALNRGLTIRAVLINQGIPSTRIYLLAKGVPPQPEKNAGVDYVEMIRSDLMTTKPNAKQTK